MQLEKNKGQNAIVLSLVFSIENKGEKNWMHKAELFSKPLMIKKKSVGEEYY